MSENVELVAQINAGWRIIVVPRDGRTQRSWEIQYLRSDGWHGRARTCAASMLAQFVLGWAGPVDVDAAATIAALPARSNVGGPRMPRAGKRQLAADRKAAAAAARKAAAAARPQPKAPAATVQAPPVAVKREDPTAAYWWANHRVRVADTA
jgi:hypothetical protein